MADALLGADPELAGYQRWRDERAAEHYEWSYRAAHWPVPERSGPLFAGLAADPLAAQDGGTCSPAGRGRRRSTPPSGWPPGRRAGSNR